MTCAYFRALKLIGHGMVAQQRVDLSNSRIGTTPTLYATWMAATMNFPHHIMVLTQFQE